MVSRTHIVRKIEPADRAENERFIQNAIDRGAPEEAEMYRRSFADWEREQGQEREELVCAVCGDCFLKPTQRGTARPHRRWGIDEPSWDRVRQLRKEFQTVQAELDRVLEALEP